MNDSWKSSAFRIHFCSDWKSKKESQVLKNNSKHGLFTGQLTNGKRLGWQRGYKIQRLENKRNRFSKFDCQRLMVLLCH